MLSRSCAQVWDNPKLLAVESVQDDNSHAFEVVFNVALKASVSAMAGTALAASERRVRPMYKHLFDCAGLDANCVVDVQMCSFDMGNRDETRLEVLAPMSLQSQLQWDDDFSAQLQVCACLSLFQLCSRAMHFNVTSVLGDTDECHCDLLRRQGMSNCKAPLGHMAPNADSRHNNRLSSSC